MRSYLTIGSSPAGESCAQVGSPDYNRRMRAETRAFINQLTRLFGAPPGNADFRVKSSPHDFGTYYEVVVAYDDDAPEEVKFAFHVENNTPEAWDDEALKELEKAGYSPPEDDFGALDESTLHQFTGTEGYHRWSPLFQNVVLSDGAKYVADNGGQNGAYWLMDAIASHIPRAAKKHPMLRDMQFWELTVNMKTKSAVLTCVPDSDMKPVVRQRIPYTDFDLPSIKFYVQPQQTASGMVWVIFLPSEY